MLNNNKTARFARKENLVPRTSHFVGKNNYYPSLENFHLELEWKKKNNRAELKRKIDD